MEEDDVPQLVNVPDSTTYAAAGSLIGTIAVLLMLVTGFLLAEGTTSMDSVQPVEQFNSRALDHGSDVMIFITLDSLFVVGYISLFAGLYLLTRDFAEVLSLLAFGLGMLTALLDLVENALLFTLVRGIGSDWSPQPGLYQLVFSLNNLIDLLSYAAALLFAVIFLVIYKPPHQKFVLGLLLIIYVVIGLGSFIAPVLLLVRSFVFVIGLCYGTFVLIREEDISEELLQEILHRESGAKNDFIR